MFQVMLVLVNFDVSYKFHDIFIYRSKPAALSQQSSDTSDMEVAMVCHGISQDSSSLGSHTDLASRAATETPSEFSEEEDDDDRSSPLDMT